MLKPEQVLQQKSTSKFCPCPGNIVQNWQISDINVWNFHETLTYNVISFEPLGPDCLADRTEN